MNKLFIDNESYDIEEDNITISQIKRKIYVNGKLISETNREGHEFESRLDHKPIISHYEEYL